MKKTIKPVKQPLNIKDGRYKQIVLCNTNRQTPDFLKGIEVRKNILKNINKLDAIKQKNCLSK